MNIEQELKHMSFDFHKRRKERGLTLEDIAKRVGVTKGTVQKWESGAILNMKSDKILSLANILDVSPLVLLSRNKSADSFLDKTAIMYYQNGELVYDVLSYDSYEYIIKTIDLLKDKEKK